MFLITFYSPFTKGWVHVRSVEDGMDAVKRALEGLSSSHKYEFIGVKRVPLNYESKRYLR